MSGLDMGRMPGGVLALALVGRSWRAHGRRVRCTIGAVLRLLCVLTLHGQAFGAAVVVPGSEQASDDVAAAQRSTAMALATQARNRLVTALADRRVDDLEAWHQCGSTADRLSHQAATKAPPPAAGSRRPGETWSPFTPGDRMVTFAWMPPGTFMMGSAADERDRKESEGPRRPVLISRGFWMMTTEVTQQVWQAVMGSNPSWFHGRDGRAGGEQHPVERISWYDAVDFANRLTEEVARVAPTLGLKPHYELRSVQRNRESRITSAEVRRIPGNRGFRLPTEAEWEYACRAGTTTRYHGGDSISSTQAVFGLSGWGDVGSTAPVGSRGAAGRSAWGLDDMHGNVWEWCWDWYDSGWYGSDLPAQDDFGRRVDPTGPASGASRVVRGGSWDNDPRLLRAACRMGFTPSFGGFSLGVRLVLDAE